MKTLKQHLQEKWKEDRKTTTQKALEAVKEWLQEHRKPSTYKIIDKLIEEIEK